METCETTAGISAVSTEIHVDIVIFLDHLELLFCVVSKVYEQSHAIRLHR